jgi:hypothetical protein
MGSSRVSPPWTPCVLLSVTCLRLARHGGAPERPARAPPFSSLASPPRSHSLRTCAQSVAAPWPGRQSSKAAVVPSPPVFLDLSRLRHRVSRTEPSIAVAGPPRAALGQATSFCGCVLAVACPSATARHQCHQRSPEPPRRHHRLPQPSWPRMLAVTSLWAAPRQATLLLGDVRSLLPPPLATGEPPLPADDAGPAPFPLSPNSLALLLWRRGPTPSLCSFSLDDRWAHLGSGSHVSV